MPKDPRLAALIRQTTWVEGLLKNHGGVATGQSEVRRLPLDISRYGHFTYSNPNGEVVRIIVELVKSR